MAVLLGLDAGAHDCLLALTEDPAPWRAVPDGSHEYKPVEVLGRRFRVSRNIRVEPLPVLRIQALDDGPWTIWAPADAPRGRPVEVEFSGERGVLDVDIAALASLRGRPEAHA